MVEIEKLSVIYRDGDHSLVALDRISLHLQTGRVSALIGESGSGKTTIGNAIMGLLPQNACLEGSIRLDGNELTGLDEESYQRIRWRKVAMVFQNGAAAFNPVQRIVDQIAEPLIYHVKMKRDQALQTARKRLAAMGFSSEEMSRYPHELSGGQAQKALFAMALILDPEVLILDEPTSAMDAALKSFTGSMIKDLSRQGLAILLITHDLDLAVKTADNAAMLYLGQIMETLPARDIMLKPYHPYTLAIGRSFPAMDAVRDLGGMRGDAFYRYTHVHRNKDGHMQPHIHIAAGADEEQRGHAPAFGCLFRMRCTQAVEECSRAEVPLTTVGNHQVRCLRGGIVDLLRFDGINKKYGRTKAVEAAGFSVRAGEVFSIVGETGSGKTTLAMIAAGALKPDSGTRIFKGRDMDEWLAEDRLSLSAEIGIIYQNPSESVSHRFSVFDIVAEPLRIQKKAKDQGDEEIQRRVLKAIADVHLPTEADFLARHPHELNMGAIQRLCIARALVHQPAFIVADEPTSALDPSVQAKVVRMLLTLQIEKGLTMVFVTHDLGLARKISDRICVMLAGRIVEIGPAASVIAGPRHPYTKALLESARGSYIPTGSTQRSSRLTGCPFADRCERHTDECLLTAPPRVDLDERSHCVWCFHPFG